MSYKYEGVLNVVRRCRATLLFSVGVLLVKPRGWGGGWRRTGFLLLDGPSLEGQTPSSVMFMGIIMEMCNIDMRVF